MRALLYEAQNIDRPVGLSTILSPILLPIMGGSSIAHAANPSEGFLGARARIDLREGREVLIPGIGKFTGGANEAIHFTTDPHLQIEACSPIPFFRNSTAVDQKKEEAISNIIERTNHKGA